MIFYLCGTYLLVLLLKVLYYKLKGFTINQISDAYDKQGVMWKMKYSSHNG